MDHLGKRNVLLILLGCPSKHEPGKETGEHTKQIELFLLLVRLTSHDQPPYCFSNQAIRPDESRPFVVKLVTLCKINQITSLSPLWYFFIFLEMMFRRKLLGYFPT